MFVGLTLTNGQPFFVSPDNVGELQESSHVDVQCGRAKRGGTTLQLKTGDTRYVRETLSRVVELLQTTQEAPKPSEAFQIALRPGERLWRLDWAYGDLHDDGGSNSGAGSFWFAVQDSVARGEELEKLQAVAKALYKPYPEHQARGWNPNWGDIVEEVDFSETAFRFLHVPQCDSSVVDHDETLDVDE